MKKFESIGAQPDRTLRSSDSQVIGISIKCLSSMGVFSPALGLATGKSQRPACRKTRNSFNQPAAGR